MRLVNTKQRSTNNKLCKPRVPPRHQKIKQPQQQKPQLQKPQQQKPQQIGRSLCHRRLQPCLARASPAAGECLSADENDTKASDCVASPKPLQVSLSLEDELPTISADPSVPRTTKRTRSRHGYRIFYRPVSSNKNYYTVPFPPPESLRLECDGDERIWQDMEVRVISHAGIVVWQNMLTPSEEPNSNARKNAFAPRSVHRKFGPRTYGMPQSAINKRRTPRKAQLQTLPSALLSIEATIHHGMCDMTAPRPTLMQTAPAQPQPLGSPRRATTARQMISVTTVSHSNAMGAASARGNTRPLYLMHQLKKMQQSNSKEIEQAQLQAQQQHQQQQAQQQLEQATKLPSLRLVQLQPGAKGQRKDSKYPLPTEIAQRSKIPRLKSNWYQQKKSRWQSGSRELPEEEMQRLRRKLLQKLRNFHRHSPIEASSGQQVSCGCRSQLPSYMRPYSPVLHYPTPSQLPVPIINRGARRTGGGGAIANGATATLAEVTDTWGIN